MSFPKYPAYKDSGVEWLGEVPEHWHAIALSRVLAEPVTDGPHTTPEFQDDGVPFLSVDGIQNGRLTFEGCRYVSFDDHKEFSKKAAPKYNDLLMGKAASVGKIARVTENIEFSIWSPLALIRADVEKCAPEFLEFCLKSSALQHQILLASNSNTQLNIGMKDIPKLRIPLPGTQEQTQIARFLDHETARIDALIEEQQRLIELLKEKRQAVISHAVTKGLDPSVPMKDSGVEWLGEVPAHWVVSRVKNIVSFITSGPRGWSDYIDDSGEDIFLQSGDMDNRLNVLFDKAKRIITPDGAEGVRTRIQKGDVLVCITGANTGRVAVVKALDQTCYVNQHLGLLRPRSLACDSQYLGYALASTSCQTYFSIEQYGLKEGLSLTDLAEAPLAIPPIAEQIALVKRIEEQLIALHRLSADAEQAALILAERRSALISAAVTGKIDVRNWQPPAGQYPAGDTRNRTEPEVV